MKLAICAFSTCNKVFERTTPRVTCSEVCKKAHRQQQQNLWKRERYTRDPDYRKRMKERNRKRWANPEYRKRMKERHCEWRREQRADPEYREWENEQRRELGADPEYRERMNEHIRYRYKKGQALLKFLRKQGKLQRPLSRKERDKLSTLYEKLVAGQSVTSEQTTRMAREESRRRAALFDQTNEPTPDDEKTDA